MNIVDTDIAVIVNRYIDVGTPIIRCVECAIPAQPREVYYGNREYKRHLLLPNTHSMHKKSTQLLFRLNEGNGRALYLIGVEDSGRVSGLAKEDMLTSLDNFIQMSQIIKCRVEKINVYRMIAADAQSHQSHTNNRFIATIRISRPIEQICESSFAL
jgi:GTPase